MIGYLIDRFKNRKKDSSENNNNELIDINDEQYIDDSEIIVEKSEESAKHEEGNEQAELLDEKSKKKRKRKKLRLKRKKIRKYRGPLFFLSFLFIIGFLVWKLLILYSDEEYILVAKLNYVHSVKAYKLTYEIENMDNSFNIKINEEVCTPTYYTSTDTVVRKSSDVCLKGKVISVSGNRAEIEYKNLPKYIAFDDLFLYLDKTKIVSNTTIGKVNIKMKYFMNHYQILSIYP